MAKIKLTTSERTFIPDVDFETDEGTINNRDLPSEDQVVCEISLASNGQKSKYIDSYSVTGKKKQTDIKTKTQMNYSLCVSTHCKKVQGLEDFGVTDGKTLISHDPTPELNEIIREIFFKVNGIHEEDEKPGSDGGDFSEGE